MRGLRRGGRGRAAARRLAVALAVGALASSGATAYGIARTNPSAPPRTVHAATASPPASVATAPLPFASRHAPGRIVSLVDVPNPFVLHEDGRYLVYSTQSPFANVPLRAGPELDRLEAPIDVLPDLPAWARKGYTWAPDVRRVGDGYVLWFTAALRGGRWDAPNASQCIGVAVAPRPEGPFRSVGDEPAVCQLDRWGSIDPRTFEDEHGDLWLHWKSDDNAQVGGTGHAEIFAQRLAEDGTTLLGEPIAILTADQAWEGHIVEAPQMVRAGGRHWLFYSGNWFNQPSYGIGVASCDGPAGPCRKPYEHPWLSTNRQGAGPGEASLFEDGDGWWIAYSPVAVEYERHTTRPLAVAPVAFGPDTPYLARRAPGGGHPGIVLPVTLAPRHGQPVLDPEDVAAGGGIWRPMSRS